MSLTYSYCFKSIWVTDEVFLFHAFVGLDSVQCVHYFLGDAHLQSSIHLLEVEEVFWGLSLASLGRKASCFFQVIEWLIHNFFSIQCLSSLPKQMASCLLSHHCVVSLNRTKLSVEQYPSRKARPCWVSSTAKALSKRYKTIHGILCKDRLHASCIMVKQRKQWIVASIIHLFYLIILIHHVVNSNSLSKVGGQQWEQLHLLGCII